jgi:hypothetical protein
MGEEHRQTPQRTRRGFTKEFKRLCCIWSTGGMPKPLLAEGSDRQSQLVERGGNSKACWLLDRELVVVAPNVLHQGMPGQHDREVSCRQSRWSDPNTANAQPRPPPAFMATMATLKRPGTSGDSDVPEKPAWNEEG